jgi:hypothetical protein
MFFEPFPKLVKYLNYDFLPKRGQAVLFPDDGHIKGGKLVEIESHVHLGFSLWRVGAHFLDFFQILQKTLEDNLVGGEMGLGGSYILGLEMGQELLDLLLVCGGRRGKWRMNNFIFSVLLIIILVFTII